MNAFEKSRLIIPIEGDSVGDDPSFHGNAERSQLFPPEIEAERARPQGHIQTSFQEWCRYGFTKFRNKTINSPAGIAQGLKVHQGVKENLTGPVVSPFSATGNGMNRDSLVKPSLLCPEAFLIGSKSSFSEGRGGLGDEKIGAIGFGTYSLDEILLEGFQAIETYLSFGDYGPAHTAK